MLTTSDTTDVLDAALAKAQASLKAAQKDKINPAFRSTYADLTAVWDACREALTAHGISVTQWPLHSEDGRLHLVTRMACGGQWMSAHFSLPVAKADAHGFGSATTYARRFALAAAVGVVADLDDDANGATGKTAPAEQQPARGGGAGRGGDTVRARKPAPRPAAGGTPSLPSSAGGTPHPGGISAATYEALTDLCQQLQAVGGDPGTVIHDLTGKRKRADLTEAEGRTVGQAMLSLVVDGQKGGEAA